jgi:hypothetical protein
MARNYSQNLGEETLKGMTDKARAGMCPSCAPIGYRNTEGADSKRVIVPDPDSAPPFRLFKLFASGDFSLKELAAKARDEDSHTPGLTNSPEHTSPDPSKASLQRRIRFQRRDVSRHL